MFQVNQIYYENGKSNSARFGKTGRYGIAFGKTRTIDVADTLDDARRLAYRHLTHAIKDESPDCVDAFIIIERTERDAYVYKDKEHWIYNYDRKPYRFNPKTGKLVR